MDSKLLAQWSINVLYAIFVVGHLIRSIWLNKGFSSDTLKMYLITFLIVVISNLGFGNMLSSEVLASLISACVGFVVGKQFENEKDKAKAN